MNPLSHLSNNELEARLKDLVQKERKLLHVILEHIREVDSRKLYLGKAYSSIYEYLTKELHYSGSAAMRRLEAARLLRDVPQVAERIQEGSLNLSQIGELSRAIKEKEKISGEKVMSFQKHELIEMVSGKTTQETQHELSRKLNLPIKEIDSRRVQKDESVRLELTLSKEQYEKLMQCKDLAAHMLLQGNGSVSIPEVIEFLANQYLDDKFKKPKEISKTNLVPQAELIIDGEQNEQSKLIASNKTSQSIVRAAAAKSSKAQTHSKSAILTTDAVVERKSVTPKMRRLIFERDRCCQYVDLKTGKKCGSSFALQVDHRSSKWAGGGNSLQNLQLLCSQHNRGKYRAEIGVRFK
ncbi:HNH endonuclease [Bdellovibrio reynosensis]|uniref:HNH endonuclease n=1 Tax=Bdellovibrio reynosensis TaxID=2835041 RepID=A0ABY4CAS5_9BACT|nr:HNH endonuclease signature motif containing protein [Bdellovibrio reynosensis]UOF00992.1 HNH endonuclease [Bdellovibrio reynosensis]